MWEHILAITLLLIFNTIGVETTNPIYKKLSNDYHYIVIGAGSAGCIVAARLAERNCNKILLIEAGDSDLNYPDIKIPYNAGLLSKEGLDWKYKTVPQKHVLGKQANQSFTWSRGKVVGGSGNTNYMGFDRGSAASYNLWGNMASQIWKYNNIFPVFKKMETYHNDGGGYRGIKGPVNINDVSSLPAGEMFVNAGKELGYNITDTNGKDTIGFMYEQVNIKMGQRWSSSFAYLHPAMAKFKNLHVLPNTLVTKILFRNKKAVGVQVISSDNSTFQYKARKEIILCAGVIGSPQILMLSGIGPKQHLDEMGIPVIADLPVGKNLQEQVMVSHPFISDIKVSLTADEIRTPENLKIWNETGRGFLTFQGSQGRGLIYSSLAKDNLPDLELFQKMFTLPCKQKGSISDEEFQYYESICKHHGFTVLVLNTQPKSQGEIRLKTTNPKDHPIIDFQYWSHPDDLKVIAEGLLFLCKLNATNAFRTFSAHLPDIPFPPCAGHQICSMDYFECYAKYFTSSMSHASGTCKMSKDKSAVVNPYLKIVGGIKRIRVCDASIFPIIPSASINGPSMMVGEKCADLIKFKK